MLPNDVAYSDWDLEKISRMVGTRGIPGIRAFAVAKAMASGRQHVFCSEYPIIKLGVHFFLEKSALFCHAPKCVVVQREDSRQKQKRSDFRAFRCNEVVGSVRILLIAWQRNGSAEIRILNLVIA
jgi:hypothetical protein